MVDVPERLNLLKPDALRAADEAACRRDGLFRDLFNEDDRMDLEDERMAETKEFSESELIEFLGRAVKGARAHRRHRGKSPRRVAVMETFALGSTYAHLLCRRFDLNPDEMVS